MSQKKLPHLGLGAAQLLLHVPLYELCVVCSTALLARVQEPRLLDPGAVPFQSCAFLSLSSDPRCITSFPKDVLDKFIQESTDCKIGVPRHDPLCPRRSHRLGRGVAGGHPAAVPVIS